MHVLFGFGAAALSGIGFALIGVAYRIGQARGITPISILMIACIGGVGYFSRQSNGVSLQSVPWVVWVLAIAAGIGQVLTVLLVPVALRYGPLTPLWCAVSLSFIPVTLLAHFLWGEGASAMQWLGVLMGAACVVISAFAQHPTPGLRQNPARPGARAILLYAGLLALVLVSNSLLTIGMKYLGLAHWQGRTLGAAFSNIFLVGSYAALLLGMLLHQAVMRVTFSWRVLPLGLLAMLGSVGGLALLSHCSALVPAALAFTASGIVSLLAIALIAVFAFRERANVVWYAMMGTGVAAVVLVNIGKV